MEAQPICRRQFLLARCRIIVIDLTQHLQHVTAFVGKVWRDVYKLSSAVRKAVGQQDFDSGRELRCVARKRIAHLYRRAQACCAMFQHIGQILSRRALIR
jgi:hypothetical protein